MKQAVAGLLGPIKEAHQQWGWYLALGIGLTLLGAYAVYAEPAATLASVVTIGVIVMLSGVLQLAGAFVARGAGHVVLLLLIGALDVFVGLTLMAHPGMGALTLTLLLAMLFTFGGLYRFVSALVLQLPGYGWVAFGGLLATVLGILLWMQWPTSSVWFIGFAVGVNLLIAGITWSATAFNLKNLHI